MGIPVQQRGDTDERCQIVGRDPIRYRDSADHIWTVTERERGGARTLVFMGDNCFRLVHHFPENWRSLSAAELERVRGRL